MGRPRRLPSGRWNIQVRLSGMAPESRTFNTREAAIEWRDRRAAELRRLRRQQQRAGGAVGSRTLRDLVEHFGRVELPKYRKAKTSRGYKQKLGWWAERLGDLPLHDLTAADIAECRDLLALEHAPGTVNRYLAALSRALSLAAGEWMWIPTNPMAGLRRQREPRRRITVKGERREPYLDAAERGRLLGAVRETGRDDLVDLVVLALSTGARQAELLGLRWRRVSFDAAAQVATLAFVDTKNRDSRSVDVVGPGYEVLQRRRQVRRLGNDHVFPGRASRPALFPRWHWERARTAAGFPELRFHDLRHCFASELVMSGASLPEVADILGHRTLAMVQRYAHFAQGHSAAVARRAAARMWGE